MTRTNVVQKKFDAALDALIEQVKQDRSVLAAILCGSLSHDRVWSKSDIDLVFITVDNKKIEKGGVSLYADGINVHAFLMPRAEFHKLAEGALRNSFIHFWRKAGCFTRTIKPSRTCAIGCTKSASATMRYSFSARQQACSRRFTRRTNSFRRAAT
jgi:predicted nucleotidyltransferase